MSRPETQILKTTAGPGTLVDIETALERVWSAHPHVPPMVRMHMGIAAGEIGANIIEHAAPGRQVSMTMDAIVTPGQVQVEFIDDGDPVQVNLETVCLPEDMAERGRGLALAQAVLAQLSYRRAELNHWLLVSKPFA